MNEENKNEVSKTEELIDEMYELACRMVDKAKESNGELCAFVVIGSKDKFSSMMHSDSGTMIGMSIANSLIVRPYAFLIVESAVETARKRLNKLLNRDVEDETV